ncbi:MAG: DUF1043 family protein [Pseudomonadota bacterium]
MISTFGALVAGLVCFLAGLGIGYWFARSGREIEASKVAAAESALADYKDKVNSHFETTAQHFNLIGQQYRDLYEHMATSSESLLGDGDERANPFPRLALMPAAADADVVADADDVDEVVEAAVATDDSIDAESATAEVAADDTTDDASAEAPKDYVVAADTDQPEQIDDEPTDEPLTGAGEAEADVKMAADADTATAAEEVEPASENTVPIGTEEERAEPPAYLVDSSADSSVPHAENGAAGAPHVRSSENEGARV